VTGSCRTASYNILLANKKCTICQVLSRRPNNHDVYPWVYPRFATWAKFLLEDPTITTFIRDYIRDLILEEFCQILSRRPNNHDVYPWLYPRFDTWSILISEIVPLDDVHFNAEFGWIWILINYFSLRMILKILLSLKLMMLLNLMIGKGYWHYLILTEFR